MRLYSIESAQLSYKDIQRSQLHTFQYSAFTAAYSNLNWMLINYTWWSYLPRNFNNFSQRAWARAVWSTKVLWVFSSTLPFKIWKDHNKRSNLKKNFLELNILPLLFPCLFLKRLLIRLALLTQVKSLNSFPHIWLRNSYQKIK